MHTCGSRISVNLVKGTDIAIVGSGAAGTHCLLRILHELRGTSGEVHITLIDKDKQFHSGIPYGHRSGPSSLLITTLSEFLPHSHLADFTQWLNVRRETILTSSAIDCNWIARHRDDIRSGQWEGLHIPRRLYGRYLQEKAEFAIRRAAESKSARVEFVNTEITAAVPDRDGTTVLRSPSCTEIRALTVVLAVGSPPVRELRVSEPASGPMPGYVSDIHMPTVEETLERVGDVLRGLPPERRRVLIVGGNADALEFILASAAVNAETGATLSVLSPQGRPHYWRHQRPDEEPEIDAVRALLNMIEQGTAPGALALQRAVEQDVAQSILTGSDKATAAALMDCVSQIVGHMDGADLAEMVASCGLAISKLLRRAGGDAIDLLGSGAEEETVTFTRGRFESAIHCDGLFTVTASRCDGQSTEVARCSSNASETVVLDEKYAAIINATGFEAVAETRSPLLRQLLNDGVVSVSTSAAGLTTDGRYRAAPGIYVLGPLLSGYNHEGTIVWHAESVSRIIHLAAEATPLLLGDTLSRRTSRAAADGPRSVARTI